MTTDHPARRKELFAGYRALSQQVPTVMTGFGQMHDAAVADGALSTATKELMAVAISITSRCEDCITVHVQAALRAGATADQVREAIGVAIMMGGGPASIYAADALDALEQFSAAT